MSEINTEFLSRCIETLEKSYELLCEREKGSIDYEIFRNSLVKGFEMTLEQSGKLLKKKITPYFATKKAVDLLTFKDLFRYAQKHGILNEEEVLRWFAYRDNRNDTAHDYGQQFAEQTLSLIENFIRDAKSIRDLIDND
ncbi:nucleotidyltransferase [Alphaproteobacteria bacterium]|nr:nucleotidyltransferase [Alphaproteobacteria bacterium]